MKFSPQLEAALVFAELVALVVAWTSLLFAWKLGLLLAAGLWCLWRVTWAYLLESHFRVEHEHGVARRRLTSTIWFGRIELGVLLVAALALSTYGRGTYEMLTAGLGWFVAHVFWREELKLWKTVRPR